MPKSPLTPDRMLRLRYRSRFQIQPPRAQQYRFSSDQRRLQPLSLAGPKPTSGASHRLFPSIEVQRNTTKFSTSTSFQKARFCTQKDYDKEVWVQWCEKAEQLRQQRKFGEALELLTKAAQREPLEARPLSQRATIFMSLKQYKDAITDLEALLKLDPSHPPALTALGDCYKLNGNPETARSIYNRVIENDSKFVRARLARAELLIEFGEDEQAIRDVKFVVKSQGPSTDEMLHAGHLFLTLNCVDEAQELYEKIGRIDPSNPAAHTGLGIIFYAKEDFAKASDAFTLAIERAPSSDLYAKRAGCYLQFHNYAKALADCQSAKDALAQEPQVDKANLEALHLVHAQALYHQGRHQPAIVEFEAFLSAAHATFAATKDKAKSAEWIGSLRMQLYTAELLCSDCYSRVYVSELKRSPSAPGMPTTELKQSDVEESVKKLKNSSALIPTAPANLKAAVAHCLKAASLRGLEFGILEHLLWLQLLVENETNAQGLKRPKSSTGDDLFAVLPK